MASGGERLTSLLGLLKCNSNSNSKTTANSLPQHAPAAVAAAAAPAPVVAPKAGSDLSKLLAAVSLNGTDSKQQLLKDQLAASVDSASAGKGVLCFALAHVLAEILEL